MASADFIALLPLLVTAVSSLIVLLLAAFRRDHLLVAIVTSLGLTAALMTLPIASRVAPRQVTSLLMVDAYAIFYIGLLLAASLAITGLSYGYLEKREEQPEEFYVLLLLATLGGITLAAATHLASFFLGLELLSVSLYVLIAYVRTDTASPRSRTQVSDPLRDFLRVSALRHGLAVFSIRDDGIRRYGLSPGSAGRAFLAIPRRPGADPDRGGLQAGRGAVPHVGT